MTEFTTKEVAIDIYGTDTLLKSLGFLNDLDDETCVLTEDVNVKWEFGMEMRNWGIGDMFIVVPEQKVSLTIEYYNKDEDRLIEVDKEVTLKDVEVDYGSVTLGDSIAPQCLEYYDGKWTLQFGV